MFVFALSGRYSYDAYLNFEARGRHFHELVMSL